MLYLRRNYFSLGFSLATSPVQDCYSSKSSSIRNRWTPISNRYGWSFLYRVGSPSGSGWKFRSKVTKVDETSYLGITAPSKTFVIYNCRTRTNVEVFNYVSKAIVYICNGTIFPPSPSRLACFWEPCWLGTGRGGSCPSLRRVEYVPHGVLVALASRRGERRKVWLVCLYFHPMNLPLLSIWCYPATVNSSKMDILHMKTHALAA